MSRSPSPDARNGGRSRSRSPKPRREKRRSYSRSPDHGTGEVKRLHIADLDDTVRRRDIEDAFSKFGPIEDLWMASYPPLYAFVVFSDPKDGARALKEMDRGYVGKCKIRVSVALPRGAGRSRGGPPPRRSFRSRSRSRSPRRDRDRRRSSRSPRRERRRRSRS